MRENRHFLSFRKGRHDAENPVHYITLGSRCKMASNHRLTDLEKIPVHISKDEAPTPLPVVGPLFISSLLSHLSRTLLGAWRFSLFRSVYSRFHNRLDLMRQAAFFFILFFFGGGGGCFSPNLSLFHHNYLCKQVKK